MKIVVIGGTGVVGAKLVEKLRLTGHHPLAASRATGIDAIIPMGAKSVVAS